MTTEYICPATGNPCTLNCNGVTCPIENDASRIAKEVRTLVVESAIEASGAYATHTENKLRLGDALVNRVIELIK